MLFKSNLAISEDPQYNKLISKAEKASWKLVIHNKKAMIMRENVLASGMEISDIDTARELTK